MSILRLTVALEGIEPQVVRTLMVPIDLRLDRLHLVLQAAMGWQNMHLYEFTVGAIRWSLPDPDYRPDVLPATKVSLREALTAVGSAPLRYTYDFGDNWRHLITSASTDGPLPNQIYPRLVDAQGRCPPEDVGGISGYAHFLAAIADPRHPDHDDLIEWHDGPFDPDVPPTDGLQLDVLRLAKRWKPKKQ